MWGYLIGLIVATALLTGGSVGVHEAPSKLWTYVPMIVSGCVLFIAIGMIAYYNRE
jgi:hypothetical protein